MTLLRTAAMPAAVVGIACVAFAQATAAKTQAFASTAAPAVRVTASVLAQAERVPSEWTTPPTANATPSETAPPAAPTSAAPAAEAARGVPVPPLGKGQIVFFRRSRFARGGVSYSIREGDAGVARLGNGRYFIHITDPGIHEYNTESEWPHTVRIEVQEGETYFVQQLLNNTRTMEYSPALTLSDRAEFEKEPLRLTTRPGVARRRDRD
jgi:hypothetical protein